MKPESAVPLQNIAARNGTQEALREIEKRLRRAQQAGGLGMWDWNLRTGEVQWSEGSYALLGVEPDSIDPSREGWVPFILAEDLPGALAAVQEAVARGGEFEMEFRVRRTDGEVRWILSRGQVEPGDDGKPEYMRGVNIDVTDRKQIENALRESQRTAAAEVEALQRLQNVSTRLIQAEDPESLYDLILDTAVSFLHADFASMQVVKPDCDDANELRLLGFRGFSPEAARFWERVHPSSESTCGAAMRTHERVIVPDVLACDFMQGSADLETYLQTGIRAVQTTPLLSRDGRLLGMISTHWRQPHEPAEGELRLLDVLARQAADLIERTRSEQALKTADRRKDEFLATLAHELRNPLAPIQHAVEIVQRCDDPTAVSEAVSTLERQVTHMVRLVDDLLDLSRITRDRLELRKARIDLKAAIAHAVEASRPAVEEADHKLNLLLPDEPLVVEGDLARLGQAMANLLGNACRYTDPGGQITLAAERQGSDAVVRVADTGIGIPADMLDRVFDTFSQVTESKFRSRGGLGIGLSLVRRLVELHGGRVTARSDGSGKGSEFTVRLPLLIEASTKEKLAAPVIPATAAAPTATPTAAAPRRRILVVDDNRDAARILSRLLSLGKHDVRTAHDGAEAIEVAESYRPEVILLDIGLPEMSGYDVCRAIRRRSWGEQITIVALTGWGQEEDRRKSSEAGFDEHLVKPVDYPRLARFLSELPSPPSRGTLSTAAHAPSAAHRPLS